MQSKEELKELYEKELKTQLSAMESKRKFVRKYRLFAICSIVLAFLLLGSDYTAVKIIGFILFAATAFYTGAKALSVYNDYHKRFKNEVVRKIIRLLNPKYRYNSGKHIEVYDYNKAGIFKRKAERCIGDDLITGEIEKVSFKFSEVKAEYKTSKTDDQGKPRYEWHQIFRGLFFYAEFNKNIEGQTFIFPEKDRNQTNIVGKEKENSTQHGQLVKLENPEFEKIFSVYGSSQQEARYILTPVMMEAIVNIYRKYGLKMYFSFRGEYVFCAIPFSRNLFEPNIKKSGVNYRDVEEMHSLFSLIETIIKEMNLNTRIWSKV